MFDLLASIPHELPGVFWTWVFVMGAILGSFWNCAIYRLPREISLLRPGSFCPQCKHTIAAYDNIPIFSFLLLWGRCRYCHTKISARYFVVEIVSAVWMLFIVSWVLEGPFQGWGAVQAFGVILLLHSIIPVTLIDLEHRIIPDEITFSLIILGICISFAPGGVTPVQSLLGILAGGGPLYLIGWLGEKIFKKGEAMGGGDIKLMAGAGALIGPQAVLLALLFGTFLGAFFGVVFMAIQKLGQDHRIAFGPYLHAGIVISLFWGQDIFNGYMHLIGLLV